MLPGLRLACPLAASCCMAKVAWVWVVWSPDGGSAPCRARSVAVGLLVGLAVGHCPVASRPPKRSPGVYLTDATIESDNRVGVGLWGLSATTRNLLRPELECSAG